MDGAVLKIMLFSEYRAADLSANDASSMEAESGMMKLRVEGQIPLMVSNFLETKKAKDYHRQQHHAVLVPTS